MAPFHSPPPPRRAFKISFSLGLLLGFILLSISPEGEGQVPVFNLELDDKQLKNWENIFNNWATRDGKGKEGTVEAGKPCYGDGGSSYLVHPTPFTMTADNQAKLNKVAHAQLSKFCKTNLQCHVNISARNYQCVSVKMTPVDPATSKPGGGGSTGGSSGGGKSGSSSRQPIQLMTVLPGLFVVISVLLMDSFGLV